MRFQAKSTITALLLTFAVGVTAATASADQCWAVEAEQAESAVRVVRAHPDFRNFCAPCGDTTATRVVARTVEHVKRGEFDVVEVRDQAGKKHELDLAYTYVRLDDEADEFVNLAAIVGCPATGVPRRIDGKGNPLVEGDRK